MAQKYYNSAETAKILGKTVDQIKHMLEHRELHGYRDGADWKFKVEDIDRLAKDLPQAKAAAEEDGGDVLLSEVELGQSDPGLSGTVIGLNPAARLPAGGDVHLAESDLALSALADEPVVPIAAKKKPSDSKGAKPDDLSLDNLTLGDSSGVAVGKSSGGSSAVDLGGKGKDDELVLGGSSGSLSSNISLGSDSGISLVDPSDSGFSLDTPVNLAAPAEESLELSESDMLAAPVAPGAGELKTDDDFLLTPLEETTDTDGSESGSQVIALDTEGEESGTMIGAGSGVSMAAMIDEDISVPPGLEMGVGGPLAGPAVLGAQPSALAEGAAVISPAAALAEPPYTGWQIAGLAVCSVLLSLCGIMMYDLRAKHVELGATLVDRQRLDEHHRQVGWLVRPNASASQTAGGVCRRRWPQQLSDPRRTRSFPWILSASASNDQRLRSAADDCLSNGTWSLETRRSTSVSRNDSVLECWRNDLGQDRPTSCLRSLPQTRCRG